MRKTPFIFGLLVGISVCGVLLGVLALRQGLNRGDPAYQLVAVSWGSHTTNHKLWTYQMQVSAEEAAEVNGLDVTARVCIGGGNYFHDLGKLGTARDMGDAVQKFGTITWSPDSVTISGTDGLKATLPRSELQKHR